MKKVINYYVTVFLNQGRDQLKWIVEEQDIDKKIAEVKKYNKVEKIEVEKEVIITEVINVIDKENF